MEVPLATVCVCACVCTHIPYNTHTERDYDGGSSWLPDDARIITGFYEVINPQFLAEPD